jgi:alpha-glucosidase
LIAALTPALAQKPQTESAPWWRHAVFYEIYPRSFADSNNDGLGDLKGITSKLDYLHQLGVDAIWITPCYPSPQFDFGYDVADYENIDPMYGTLGDFDELTREAHRRGIRVIMDFVVNHSSSAHPWFVESKSSRTSAKRDWYIWRDGKAAGQPPNNWESDFGGSAWTFDATTSQYYYHYFEAEQPDLNWRNPAVERAMFDVTRFWHRHGVDGFRLDAVDTLFEDPGLKDNPTLPGKNEFGDPQMKNVNNDKLPEVHEELRRLRQVTDENGQVLIGETWTDSIDELKAYYGAHNDEIQMPMDFMFATVNKLSAPECRRQIAKLMASMMLTLRGTPILYYGEELGMETHPPERKEDVKDPLGISGWPLQKGRDGERRPMQWNSETNAGFTHDQPWLPIDVDFKQHNVATESNDPQSLLNFYRALLALRHANPALLDGEYLPLAEHDANVLAYLRQTKAETIAVVLNFSAEAQKLEPDWKALEIDRATLKVLLTTCEEETAKQAKTGIVRLSPYSVVILRAKTKGGETKQK